MFNQEKIDTLYPQAKMYECMKIEKGTDALLKDACSSGNYFGQIKKDGYWYQYEKHLNHSYLFSRSASKTTGLQSEKLANVPHIAAALACLPDNTILIGEIYYPGGTSKSVTSIMGCLPEKAAERQKGSYGFIHYYIHDILMYDGVDFVIAETEAWNRYKILEKIFYKHNLNQYDFLELATSYEDDLYSRIGDSLASGEEGMVIKLKSGIYVPGKRPKYNLKAKKVDFADVIIMGFEPPIKEYSGKELDSWAYNIQIGEDGFENRLQGNYKNLVDLGYNPIPVTKTYYYNWINSRIKIGAIVEGNKVIEIGVIHSGISDEMKQDMTEHPENYLNKVCSIQMMEKDAAAGTIRHGFFKFMRDDKDTAECTFESIFK